MLVVPTEFILARNLGEAASLVGKLHQIVIAHAVDAHIYDCAYIK